MYEQLPDSQDLEEYEAEQERAGRMRKRLTHGFDIADERMDEDE